MYYGKKINWIVLDDGRMKQEVIKQVELLNLKNCFFLLGQFPFNEMPSFFSSADLLLLSLKKYINHYNFLITYSTIPHIISSFSSFSSIFLYFLFSGIK